MRRACVVLVFMACGAPIDGDDAGELFDAGQDAGTTDAGSVDAGPLDAGPMDAGSTDAGADAGPADAGPLDAGSTDAGPPDAGPLDAGPPDAGPPDAGPPDAGPPAPVMYPFNQTHSPITDGVAANLRSIAARRPARERAVSKIGDSNTVNTNFLSCFNGSNVNLGTQAATLQPVLDVFRDGGTFSRVSLSATVGWSAGAAITGSPSPLQQELAANDPRIGVVMFGTNDIQSMNVDTYGRNMFAIADALIDAGVVPLLTSVPPRDDSTTADLAVPRYNAVTRGIAQARQVPYIDLERELRLLPSHGIGSDGLHLNASPNGACQLTGAGLQYGHNTRNLLTLQALGRTRDALSGRPAPDLTAPRLSGSGSAADPFVIPSLPFVDLRDTRREGTNRLSAYSGCASSADESGAELYYRLDLPAMTDLRAYVISLGAADVDIHLLSGLTAASCLVRNDRLVTRVGATGTLYFSLDTYVSGGVPLAGEYLLVVLAD